MAAWMAGKKGNKTSVAWHSLAHAYVASSISSHTRAVEQACKCTHAPCLLPVHSFLCMVSDVLVCSVLCASSGVKAEWPAASQH
eukprot:scaffold100856_cov22-Tisochrysis_lutea.AAC.1